MHLRHAEQVAGLIPNSLQKPLHVDAIKQKPHVCTTSADQPLLAAASPNYGSSNAAGTPLYAYTCITPNPFIHSVLQHQLIGHPGCG
jgi:hypothetical protein